MPALVAGIHVFLGKQVVDGRDKPGHDDARFVAIRRSVMAITSVHGASG